MNKVELRDRINVLDQAIKKLNADIQQHAGNLNMLLGAKEELMMWLTKCEDKPMEVKMSQEDFDEVDLPSAPTCA